MHAHTETHIFTTTGIQELHLRQNCVESNSTGPLETQPFRHFIK